MGAPRISALYVYPLKGARPLAPMRADIAVEGLAVEGMGDRQWMVVDAQGRFVTQRSHPRLALVNTAFDAQGASGKPALMLAAGDAGVAIALEPQAGVARDVTVWRSRVRGFDAGDAPAQWLSRWLGAEVRIVRFDPSKRRRCNPDFVGKSGAHTRFADGYPVLVIGSASLADLNTRLAARGHAALPMDRFRPNIVIDGLEPYDEDHVDTLQAVSVTLKLVKPCTRCEVTATDQATAVHGEEPLLTLSGYRHHATLAGIVFGMNAIVTGGAGGALDVDSVVEVALRF
jgi:uncharacterized protein YcbX